MKFGRLVASLLIWALFAPALLVLLIYAAAYVERGWSLVTFPHQIDYGEAPELNRALLIARGQPVYVDWAQPPYQMANYTPLYPALAAIGVPFRGADFFTGRLIAFASTLATAGLLGLTARALGTHPAGALVAGLLYLAGHPAWNWGAYQRVDPLAVALEALGLAVFCAGWLRHRRAWAVWASVPVFVAAAYSRQTVAAGAFACYAYLLFVRPRLAVGAIALYAALGVGLFGLFQALTGGQLWRHIGEGNLNRWSWEIVRFYGEPLWRHQHWLFFLAPVGFLLTVVTRRSLVPFLYVVASAATALTVGKIGSNVNYFLQLCAALALAAGVLITDLPLASAGARWLRAAAIAAALAFQVALAMWLLTGVQQLYHVPFGGTQERPLAVRALDRLRILEWPVWRLDPFGADPAALRQRFRGPYLGNPTPEDGETARLAQAHVARLPEGDVLSEDMAFTVTTGRRIYVQPFEFNQLAEQGEWPLEPLIEDVRARRFVGVVLRFRLDEDPTWHRERIGERLIAALRSAYALDASYGDYYIYRPSA